MTDELIRRSDAIEAVKAYLDLCCLTEAKFHRGMEDYNEEISTEIFEKIEPKRGEWIQTSNEWIDGTCGAMFYPYRCSSCGYETYDDYDGLYNFCPNCGARMKGADDE